MPGYNICKLINQRDGTAVSCLISQDSVSLVWCLLRAKLSYHSKAQENHGLPAYMSDAVVAEMQNGWDLNQMRTGNEETLNGTKSH